jgi:hypothetical protein
MPDQPKNHFIRVNTSSFHNMCMRRQCVWISTNIYIYIYICVCVCVCGSMYASVEVDLMSQIKHLFVGVAAGSEA